jgi:hypothetical protein
VSSFHIFRLNLCLQFSSSTCVLRLAHLLLIYLVVLIICFNKFELLNSSFCNSIKLLLLPLLKSIGSPPTNLSYLLCVVSRILQKMIYSILLTRQKNVFFPGCNTMTFAESLTFRMNKSSPSSASESQPSNKPAEAVGKRSSLLLLLCCLAYSSMLILWCIDSFLGNGR